MTSIAIEGASDLRNGSCRVIAEAGANHNNSLDRAVEMARLAADAGAWAIKYQLYQAGRLAAPSAKKYWKDDIGTRTQFEAYQLSDQLPYEAHIELAHACRELGIVYFATPFDVEAIAVLERAEAPLYKIASADITHRPLLEAVAATGKPVLLSTGASTVAEIRAALDWMRAGPDQVVLLVCTLTYPTPDIDGNFLRIDTMRREFPDFLVGFSDHTLGIAGGWLAGALGAVCIEKHYTIDKKLPDVPDHAMSVDAAELRQLVEAANRAAVLRGDAAIEVRDSELPARENARRSVIAEVDIPAGQTLELGVLGFKRPGTGIAPFEVSRVTGRRAVVDIPAGTVIEWAMLG
jgi:sialic acid synthase SpsE